MTNQPHTTFPSKKAAADHQKRMAALAAKNEEEKRILADRYKTKMCKNYVANGECPYEVRCMFAHGEEELRTSEDNIRDGLVTEEAIKTFQRQQNQAKRRMAFAAAREAEQRAASHQHHHHHHRQQQQQQQEEEQQQQMDLYMDGEAESEVMYYGHPHASMHAPRMVPHALATEHRAGYYVHNPYAFNIIPAASREFVMYEEPMPVMEGEEAAGYWYEEQMPAIEGEEDYYFPSSEMMMAQQQQQPLVPSIVASAQQQQRPRHFKLYDSVPSSSLSEEGPAYAYQQQGESADYAPHAKATHCVAADLPDFEQEAPMVLEP